MSDRVVKVLPSANRSAHYSDKVWTFPRGALSTIDRTFLGPIGTYCVHGLCETHVAHHISSKIPHYHAWEATEALKKFLGVHYQRSEENMLVSLWKSHRQCQVSTGAMFVNQPHTLTLISVH